METKRENIDTTVVCVDPHSFKYAKENLIYAFPKSFNRKVLDYLAFYRKKPVRAITHYAPVKEVIEGGEIEGKYRLLHFGDKFDKGAVKVVLDSVKKLNEPVTCSKGYAVRQAYYTELSSLKKAKTGKELFSDREQK